jgi:hypothetical protein
VVWNIDWPSLDASDGRAPWLRVIDTGTRMAAYQLVPRFTEAAHRAATLRSSGRLNAPTVSWSHGTGRLEPTAGGHDGVVLPFDRT